MSPFPRIGVIGGGASAVCLLDALAQLPDLSPGALTVFEASPYFWRGRPYQPDLDLVRVNATPDDMSVRAGDPEHLAEWLAAREFFVGSAPAFTDPISGAQFIPRAVFGDYLEQSARAALMILVNRGWDVSLVRERVESAIPTADGLSLRTTRGEEHEVNYTVLSVGAGKPADLYSLAGSPGFIMEPYPVHRSLASVGRDQDVTVVGSGLTAVDVVLALADNGHRGRIRLCSRRGALPGVRQRPVHHVLTHFMPARFRAMANRGETVTLTQLVSIMDAELAAAGEDLRTIETEIDSIRHEEPVARLRRNLSEVNSPSIALRILQQAVPDAGPDVWPLLAEHEKSHVLAEHDRVLMSLCCPMPPGNAASLLSLFDSGRLELVCGVENISPTADGFAVSGAGGDHRADVVVNAVNARLRRTNSKAASLIGSLVAAGLAELHPRVGVHVERATSRMTVDLRAGAALYALGDPAAGSLFFTFGVQSLVDRAVDIAAHIRQDSAASRRRAHVTRFGGDALQPV